MQRLLSQAIAEYKKTNLIKGVDFSKKLKNVGDLYNERKDFEISTSDVLEDLAGRFTALFHELQDERSSFTALGIDFEEKMKGLTSKLKEQVLQSDKLTKEIFKNLKVLGYE